MPTLIGAYNTYLPLFDLSPLRYHLLGMENTHQEPVQQYDYDAIHNDDAAPLQMWLEGDSLAPPCQADLDVVEAILKLAAPSRESYLYDLGCGDGRICIEATKRFGCRSAGCEIEQHLIERFKHHVSQIKDESVSSKISIVHGDLLDLSLDDATIITLYLLPESVELIKPKLEQALRRGAVLVCNTWGPKGFTPVARLDCGMSNNVPLFRYDRTSLPVP
jgi:SAM-dependent methyltransferase